MKEAVIGKPHLQAIVLALYEELSFIIPHERLDTINSMLYKHKAGAVFFGIASRGHVERQEIEATTVEGYRTGKKYVPEFGTRTMVQVVVPDAMEKIVISDIMDNISTGYLVTARYL